MSFHNQHLRGDCTHDALSIPKAVGRHSMPNVTDKHLNDTNFESGSLYMVTRKKGSKIEFPNERHIPSKKQDDGSVYKLHLAIDELSHAKLVELQKSLRAASPGEVIRRSLDAYEIFEPEGLLEKSDEHPMSIAESVMNVDVHHLYLAIPSEMKKQLDDEKASFNRTYKETIRRSLCVLSQLVKERGKLVSDLEKGETMLKENVEVDRTKAMLLALI